MMTNFISDLAIHPGEYLDEVLTNINMSQKELSQRLGRPAQTINEIIKGKKSITPDTAVELEEVLKIPSHIWLGLETEYQNALAKQKEQEKIEAEISKIALFPYLDLVKCGFCKKTKNAFEKVVELRKFFSVSRLDNIKKLSLYQPAFRVSNNHSNVTQEAIISLIQASLLKSNEIKTQAFNKTKLNNNLKKIKRTIAQKDTNIAINEIVEILASCGVAFVLLPTFKNTKIHGATFWVNGEKAILAMSLRGAYSDIFWFGFFHEIGHILLHEKREIFLEGETDKLSSQEQEADSFSSSFLIPNEKYKSFVNNSNFSVSNIKNFAKQNDILPSIIIGRLMHDGYVKYSDYWLNKLRDKYVFKTKF